MILAVPLMVYVSRIRAHVAIGTSALASPQCRDELSNHARGGSVRWSCALVFAGAGSPELRGVDRGQMIDGQKCWHCLRC